MKRPLVFDGQLFQSDAWDRGMGKYSLSLLSSIAAISKNDIHIIFTKRLTLDSSVRQAVQHAVPSAKIHLLDLYAPDPRFPDRTDVQLMGEKNRERLDIFIRDTFQNAEADFVILSLFIDRACSVFPSAVRKILLFYDLIPLQYHERYGKFASYKNYLARFKTVLEADRIWTISQTVADDLVTYVGIDKQRLCNINGAPIKRAHQAPRRPKGFKVPERYLIMPSGDDIRKNNRRAVQGFEEYRSSLQDNDIYLIITSFFNDQAKIELQQYSPNLIFSGNIPEGELRWLYANSVGLLFMPEYEGLGLPILEAVEEDKPVVCSNLTVFNEMSVDAFYYADQFDPVSIASAIHSCVMREGWGRKRRQYPDILTRYTWEATAKAALDFLNITQTKKEASRKPKLAVFTPNPSGYSAIGKVVLLLHPQLSELFEIDYYIENGRTKHNFSRPSYLPYVSNVYEASRFTAQTHKRYDAVIYHMGNSEYHLETMKCALYLPGYLVVHDTHLEGLFGVLQEYGYMHPTRADAEKKLDDLVGNALTSRLTSVLNTQKGIIVHSLFAEEAAQKSLLSKVPIIKANLPTATPDMKKQKIGTAFSIGIAGIIHEVKGLSIIEDIAQSEEFSDAHIYIFGVPMAPESTLTRLHSYPNVTLRKNVTDFEFQNIMAELDILINYRSEYRGETSLSTIEAMRMGVVPIVRNVGWYSELPDDSAVKVESPDDLIERLQNLKNDPSELSRRSKAAKRLMAQEYTYGNYVQSIANLMRKKT